jgi:hypothetical protein
MIPLNPFKYLRFVSRVIRYAQKVEDKTELGLLDQGKEVFQLLRLNMLEPKEYYETYELFRPDVTWEEKRRFLSRNQFAIVEKALNPGSGPGLLNKLAFKLYALQIGLPVATMYGLFDPNFGYCLDGGDLRSVEDLRQLLNKPEISEFMLKPISTDKAIGIMACAKADGELILLGEGRTDVEDLHRRMSDSHHNDFRFVGDSWLIEKRVRQHPWYDRYSNTYIHNFRIVTFLTKDGDVQVLGAGLGIGHLGKYIHQSGPLGLGAGIGEDGVLTAAVRSGANGAEFFDSHPETGAAIAGERPAGFEEAVELACRAHRYIPHLRFLGWDIAPTDEGPVIFETNNYWNWEKMQRYNRRGVVRGAFARELRAIIAGR